MYRRTAAISVLVILAVSALAQEHYAVPAAALDARFADFHESLIAAANRQLTEGAITNQHGVIAAPLASSAPATLVDTFAGRYWNGQPGAVRAALERVALLRPVIEPVLMQEGVPLQLAALVLVESGGRPKARSPKGALGLWQFMPETARRYGLVVSADQDERTDVLKATHAAARYLRALYARFGDWRLVFAAYNAGESAVGRAIARGGTADIVRLKSLRLLPAETREYVPAVMSAIVLMSNHPLGDKASGGPKTVRAFREASSIANPK